MGQVNTMEGNKIIAEFMGFIHEPSLDDEVLGKALWRLSDNENFYDSRMKYHTSWDWLMPVYDKFRCLVIDGEKNFRKRNRFVVLISDEIIRVNITEAYEKLIEAIQWYNSLTDKKPNT